MTVAELISELQKYPKDLRVVLDGYEYGYEDVSPQLIGRIWLVRDVNLDARYGGPHEEAAVEDGEEHLSIG